MKQKGGTRLLAGPMPVHPMNGEVVPSKMAAPLDGHCLRSFVGGYDTSQGGQTLDWTAFHWHSGDGINESVS